MKASYRLVKISPVSFRVYVSAARILRGRLGAKAPDPDTLIQRELRNRDPDMVADDYLELRGLRRATSPVAPRKRATVPGRSPRLPLSSRSIMRGYAAPADPMLN